MSQDLRIYSLSLILVLMLWTSSAPAVYGSGTNCPVLAVPVYDADNSVWSPTNSFDDSDLRDLHPMPDTDTEQGPDIDVDLQNYTISSIDDINECHLGVGAGKYYDGANHLWTLNDSLYCAFGGSNDNFRAGTEY